MAVINDYQDVLGAVENYYGAGSDQWVEFAKYGINADNLEQTLSQIPGVNVYKNNAGKITGYAYENPFATSTGGVAGEINSNLQVPTQGNGTTFRGSIPASGDYTGTGDTANLSSGAKSTATGATVTSVLSRVGTAVAGLAIGTRLGANFLDSLYRGNPDYWDKTFPTLNPQTWDSIAGTNELGKSVINAIFRIDKSKNRTQMYIPEDAFAYLAYGMAHEGFFATGGAQVPSYNPQSSEWELEYPSAYNYPIKFGGRSAKQWGGTEYYIREAIGNGTIYGFATKDATTGRESMPTFVSDAPFKYTVYTESSTPDYDSDASRVSVDGKTYYVSSKGSSYSAKEPIIGCPTNVINMSVPISAYNRDIVKLAFNGDMVETGGKEGVDKQDGATYPNTSSWDTPENAKNNIRTQYPDLYNNSIYTDVPQPNGTTERIIYYPVNMTSTNGAGDTTPTNTTVNYNNTYVDDSSTDDLLKTVLRYLYQTQTKTKNDTPNPPKTPNPTDTGTGNTPPVVVPTGSASALWTVYNPTQAQLNSFGAWLWSSNFIDQVLKLFNNPMQSIIGVHKIFASPSISGTNNITVGYLDSGVSSNVVGAQYTTINCGSVSVREQFGNVFDYNDTDVRLYLPFIGIVPLDVMDVMRGSVNVVYHVDVITGACLAEVKVTRDGSGGTLYQFAGDAAVRYPISSGSYMGVVSGVLGVVGGIASGIMSGGATLPMAAGAIASGMSHAKTQVQHSGSFAGNAGAMGGKKPYLIIERPQTAIANGYGAYQGTGANNIVSVGAISGYFKMTDVHLDGIARATESELSEIENLLLKGVIT